MRPASPPHPRPAAQRPGRDFFPSFAALDAHLEGLGLFRMVPGLERARAVLANLALVRPPHAVVQVVGTNGKGSTAAMLAALGLEHGLAVGLYTSPHFLSVRERVTVNGAPLPEAVWTALGNRLMEHGGGSLTYFEFVTCLAVLAFAEAKVDLAVMESGLGGRFDACTALEADMALFTPIGLDHRNVLGSTLREIASDKAGAVRSGKAVVTGPQSPEAMRELTLAASRRKAPLFTSDSAESGGGSADAVSPLGLFGAHQRTNARLARTAWRILRREGIFSDAARAKIEAATRSLAPERVEDAALAKAWLPGRMQRVPPLRESAGAAAPCSLGWPPFLLDGAHNSHGLAALGLSLAQAGIAPSAVIFACLADKNPAEMAPHLRALATGPIFVPPIGDNPRAMPPEELAALIGLNAVPAASLAEALERAAGHMAERRPEVFAASSAGSPLLLCGSLYLLADFYALRPDCLLPFSG